MRFEDCTVGMEVTFGRGNGEYTDGVVVKKNRVKAKVQTSEDRGRTQAGTIWSVPYSLMNPKGESLTPLSSVPISYSPFQNGVEQLILEAINLCYNHLSPENLCCDGELPTHLVNEKRSRLNRQLKGLFSALGREVDEDAAYNWSMEKQKYEKEYK